MTGRDYRYQLEQIKSDLIIGNIDYDTAKEQAAPIIAEMNAKGREIAKRHGMHFRPFTFAGLMR